MTKLFAEKKLNDKKILCVEDEGMISRMYKKGLSLAGARVIEATDGEQGLRLLKAQHVDVILLDLEMPNINGFDMLKALRKMPEFNCVPVLVLSNASRVLEEETILWLRKMDVSDIFLKCEVSLSELIERIRLAIEGKLTQKNY